MIAAVLCTLAACGDDGEEGGSATKGAAKTARSTAPTKPSGSAVATVKVRETEFALDPQDPEIPKPGLVQFDVTNAGQVPHALEVEGPDGEVETETIKPGGKATLKADLSRPGSYVWYCPVADHERRGMKGRITVAGGRSGTSADDSGKGEDSGRRDDSRKGRGRGRDDSGSGRGDSSKDRYDGGRAGGVY